MSQVIGEGRGRKVLIVDFFTQVTVLVKNGVLIRLVHPLVVILCAV